MCSWGPPEVGMVEHPQYLTFDIGGDEYAVAILRVREILQFPRVTRVPETPPWIRGVMNLRGSVVPVVDLGAKFGLGASSVSRKTCVVVLDTDLGGERTVMSIMTDRVNEVVELGASQIEPPPPFGTPVRPDCLLGIGTLGTGLACILDVDRVLGADEMLVAGAGTPRSGVTAARSREAVDPAPAPVNAAPQPSHAEPPSAQPLPSRRRRTRSTDGQRER